MRRWGCPGAESSCHLQVVTSHLKPWTSLSTSFAFCSIIYLWASVAGVESHQRGEVPCIARQYRRLPLNQYRRYFFCLLCDFFRAWCVLLHPLLYRTIVECYYSPPQTVLRSLFFFGYKIFQIGVSTGFCIDVPAFILSVCRRLGRIVEDMWVSDAHETGVYRSGQNCALTRSGGFNMSWL